jgi:alpha-L-glutamate ligase-like protein
MIKTWLGLRRAGVLGINERNLRLINDYNPRRLMRLVDDKTETKRLANAAGIQTPELYGLIRSPAEMRKLETLLNHPDGCVIKPANGSQGNGIQVILGPMRGGWRRSNGQRALLEDLKFHVNNILSGMYSLSGRPDIAMIEYRVKFDDVFDPISFGGVPDLRIIVLRGIPSSQWYDCRQRSRTARRTFTRAELASAWTSYRPDPVWHAKGQDD